MCAQNAKIVVNEVSQGSGTAEYVELLVIGEPECNNVPCIDIRGWIIDDNDGSHGSNGVASGCFRLSQDPFWECVSIGTIIVIYNEASKNPSIPADDIYDSNSDCIHIVPFGPSTPTTLFEAHETKPNSGDNSYPPVNDIGWTTTYNWQIIGMRNGGDVIQIIDPSSLTIEHSVQWGDNNTNIIIDIDDGSASSNVYFMDNSVDNNPYNNANWTTIGNVPADETPGAANNANNQSWINSMNYGCGSIDTLSIDSLITEPTCSGGGCNAGVAINFYGGVPPFTYSWNTGSTTNSINNICDGSYYVTVTDDNGCIDSTSAIINPISGITITTITSVNETCVGTSDGSATVQISGGNSPITYNWSNEANTPTINGLTESEYTVTVTDASGCASISTISISNNGSVTANIATTNGQCITNNDFNFDGNLSSPPGSCGTNCPSYIWNFGDGNTASGNAASDLLPNHTYTNEGNYTVSLTVTDGSCSDISSITVSVWAEPSITISGSNVSCFNQSDGTAISILNNGESPYSYSWSNGENTANLPNIPAGTYGATVTDQNGCSASDAITITEPTEITISESINDITCYNGNDGAIVVSPSGGSSPYNYQWSNSSSDPFINNLDAGTYTLTLSDNNSCIETITYTITDPPQITLSSTITDANCNSFNGSISITANNGSSPYSYSWNNGNTTNFNSSLSPGVYSVTVIDQNSCGQIESYTISETNLVTISLQNSTNISTNGGSDGQITLSTTGGISPYSYIWSPSISNSNTANDLIAGTYCITVYDTNNCQDDICITLTEPPGISISIMNTNPNCFGSANGSLSANAENGQSPYSYVWFDINNNNVGNGENLNNIPAGDYYVSVTDANGNAIVSNTITLSQPDPINTVISGTTPTCFGDCNGSISASSNGGTSPFTYLWSNGAIATSLGNLCAGNFDVTTTDANGCILISNFVLNNPPQITVSYILSDSILCVGEQVTALVNVSGGTQPYPSNPNDAIVWSGNGTNLSGYGTHNLTVPSNEIYNYQYQVFDANGCSAIGNFNIYGPMKLDVLLDDTITICLGNTSEVCAIGSNGPSIENYIFQWSNGFSQDSVSESCMPISESGSTVHRVILSDGCSEPDTAYTSINVYKLPSISFSALTTESCPPFRASFSATSSVVGTEFNWDFNGDGVYDTTGTPMLWTYEESGTFDVILNGTTPYGCEITDTIHQYIEIYPTPTVMFSVFPEETSFLNPTIEMDGSNSSNDYEKLLWNFDDGKTSSSNLIQTHNYLKDGTYDIALTLWNELGCFATDTQTVIIRPEFTIYIPNAINPSGYGYNDFFYPEGMGIHPTDYELYIFDRWGHQIFYSQELSTYWDGTIDGSDEIGPAGVYVYKLFVTNSYTGEKYEFIGHVTLIR